MPWWLIYDCETFFPGNRLFGDQPPVDRQNPCSFAMQGALVFAFRLFIEERPQDDFSDIEDGYSALLNFEAAEID